jgi:endonuclease-3
MKRNLKDKYDFVIDYFTKQNPDATSELKYEDPFQLLVAVVLSAQLPTKSEYGNS